MTIEPVAPRQLSALGGAERDVLDALLRLAGHGDLAAFGELYELTVVRVFGLSRSIVRNRSLAEEVTQDVYFEIWRRAASFDSRKGAAMGWMLRLTHSRAVDKVRRCQVLRSHDQTYGRNFFAPDIDTVIEQVIHTENDRQLRAALAQLTVVQRQAVHLTDFFGHTNAESSRLLQIPLPTFKARLRAALIALRTFTRAD
ncbi:MAG: sigma-70 family RNA polymerase sigma factor [Nakamurella sp.]